MDLSVILIVVIALGLGALIGWLVGSRAGAGGAQVIDSLRLQLDAVTEERDANRSAASELAIRSVVSA